MFLKNDSPLLSLNKAFLSLAARGIRQFRPSTFFFGCVTSMYVSIHTAKVNSFQMFVLPKVLFILAFHDTMRIDRESTVMVIANIPIGNRV